MNAHFRMRRFSFIPRNNPQQALRIRRHLFAVLSTLLILVFFVVVHVYGYMEPEGVEWSAIAMLVCVVGFYTAFRTGFNLRFRDASLTAAQMLSALFVITMAAYFVDKEARGIILPILLMIMYFGIYRLNSTQMITLALITIAMYGGMIALLYYYQPDRLDLRLEILHWWIFSAVSLWFALMIGHVSRLRRELALRKASIEALLERDELTGVGNRRFLTQMLEQEKNRAERTGTVFCVAMLDLDFFKRVNDLYGHHAGDKMLKSFAQIAQIELRKIDYFGRYGGEEFMLILADTTLDDALSTTERLRASVEQARHEDIAPGLVQTVSIGVVEYRIGESIEQTLLRADKAMYKAKAKGRNRVEVDADPSP